MSACRLNAIAVVPNGKDFVDIVLTKTQRKTPTVVHKNTDIGLIRKFYMRKVKFTQETIRERLDRIVAEFPLLSEIHPFYAELINVLYDRDHYKLALGHTRSSRRLITSIASDYIRLLKFGDSLYRCKQLKRAALGRMVKVIKRLGPSFVYLEQVRQHLTRLPNVDPNTRTLILCGYPNVGKSSFLNQVSRANTQVEPYAFTTKSLYVGHMDYRYLRWQVIDTPGILDHPLDERNVIEMQSITALAHLRCAILFFIDISESCGYTIEKQVRLLESIEPLFNQKPLVVVLNKVDLQPIEALDDEQHAALARIGAFSPTPKQIPCSALDNTNVVLVKEAACSQLLETRVQAKLKHLSKELVMQRLHVALPQHTNQATIDRANIPQSVLERRRREGETESFSRRRRQSSGGSSTDSTAADFPHAKEDAIPVPHRSRYTLERDEWKHDIIPEIMNGANIMDWMDPEIDERVREIEQEERRLLEKIASEPSLQGIEGGLTDDEIKLIREIEDRNHRKLMTRHLKRHKRTTPRTARPPTIVEFKQTLQNMGIDAKACIEDLETQAKKRAQAERKILRRLEIEHKRRELAQKGRSIETTASGRVKTVAFGTSGPVVKTRRTPWAKTWAATGPIVRHFDTRPKHLLSGKQTVGKRRWR